MKCPKTFSAIDVGGGELKIAGAECIERECPWWDKTRDHCIFLTIGYSLASIMFFLMRITEKMPHAEQFVAKP